MARDRYPPDPVEVAAPVRNPFPRPVSERLSRSLSEIGVGYSGAGLEARAAGGAPRGAIREETPG